MDVDHNGFEVLDMRDDMFGEYNVAIVRNAGAPDLSSLAATARTLGYNVRWWDLLLYLTLGIVIASAMQFAERHEWVPRFDIWYHLGVDGISVLFVVAGVVMHRVFLRVLRAPAPTPSEKPSETDSHE